MDATKILKLKIMSEDLKDVGKVKTLEIQNWKVIGIVADLEREITDLIFGKATFRLSGKDVLLPIELVKNIGDVIVLKVSGPNLMVFAKLGHAFMVNKEYIKKDVNSMSDINKFSSRIGKDMKTLEAELINTPGISNEIKTSISTHIGMQKDQLVKSAYEKLGIETKQEGISTI